MKQTKISFKGASIKHCTHACKSPIDRLRRKIMEQASKDLEEYYLDQVLIRLCSSVGRITESNQITARPFGGRFSQGAVIIETSHMPLDMPYGICQPAYPKGDL